MEVCLLSLTHVSPLAFTPWFFTPKDFPPELSAVDPPPPSIISPSDYLVRGDSDQLGHRGD